MASSIINSDDGVVSGTSGLKTTGGDDGALAVQSNGTEVAKFKTTELVINDGGANYDFRVEGDTDANLLFVDASTDRVGIGTTSPTGKIEVVNTSAGATTKVLTLSNKDSTTSTGTRIAFVPTANNVVLAAIDAVRTNSVVGGATDLRFNTYGSGAEVDGGAERMRIDSSGNLLVATTSTPGAATGGASIGAVADGAQLLLSRTTTTNRTQVVFYNGNGAVGSISTNGSSTTYATSSDYRLKENIVPMTGALNKVAALNPCTYTWKVDGSAGEGFIAHELQEVMPDCVSGEKDAVDDDGNPIYQGVDTSFLVATLTAAIQELSAKNDALEARIAALEAVPGNE